VRQIVDASLEKLDERLHDAKPTRFFRRGFGEDEGTSLILPDEVARDLGFAVEMPMSRITLSVNSALDGVGLTAAVATALAGAHIPCNVVAAYHHDHVFVPEELAEDAVTILHDVARSAE